MPHKSVERIEGPFEGNDSGGVAYVMIYTALNDKQQSVAFDRFGKEIGKTAGDIRMNKDLEAGELPDVSWAKGKPTPAPPLRPSPLQPPTGPTPQP